eukprot:236751-Chlamydomonas_euryale.AAC.2
MGRTRTGAGPAASTFPCMHTPRACDVHEGGTHACMHCARARACSGHSRMQCAHARACSEHSRHLQRPPDVPRPVVVLRRYNRRQHQRVVHRRDVVAHSDQRRAGGPLQRGAQPVLAQNLGGVEAVHEAVAGACQDVDHGALGGGGGRQRKGA